MYRSAEVEQETSDPTHSNMIAAIAAFLRPRIYVELGVQMGVTFNKVEPYCGIAYAVDILDVSELIENQTERRKFVKSDSVDFLYGMADDSLDLVFVDSSHEYEKTLREFTALDLKVRPNGIVCFHDSYPPNRGYQDSGLCGGVWAAIAKLRDQFKARWEFCTMPAQFGVTVARKNLGKQVLYE